MLYPRGCSIWIGLSYSLPQSKVIKLNLKSLKINGNRSISIDCHCFSLSSKRTSVLTCVRTTVQCHIPCDLYNSYTREGTSSICTSLTDKHSRMFLRLQSKFRWFFMIFHWFSWFYETFFAPNPLVNWQKTMDFHETRASLTCCSSELRRSLKMLRHDFNTYSRRSRDWRDGYPA